MGLYKQMVSPFGLSESVRKKYVDAYIEAGSPTPEEVMIGAGWKWHGGARQMDPDPHGYGNPGINTPGRVKCAHCGQYAEQRTECAKCGAPVD